MSLLQLRALAALEVAVKRASQWQTAAALQELEYATAEAREVGITDGEPVEAAHRIFEEQDQQLRAKEDAEAARLRKLVEEATDEAMLQAMPPAWQPWL